MRINKIYFLFIGLLLAMLSACNISKDLTEDEYLLHKNKIIHTDNSIRSAPLEDYLTQKPTPKFLGFFYSNVGIYYALKDKKSSFNKWLLRVFGTEPVFVDKYAAEESARHMKSYLNNLSYFNAKIDINYKTKGKKVTVEYIVNPKKPYLINHFEWVSADTAILNKINQISSESLIKPGEPYDSYTLDNERNRISDYLRSNGYYRFNKNFINYSIDSTFNNHSLSIIGEINLPISTNSKEIVYHHIYNVRDIYIYPNYNPLSIYDYAPDTLAVNIPSDREDGSMDKYYFIYYNTLRIRPKVIGRAIFLANNSLFNVEELKLSYQKLNRFSIFKYVNISFTEDSSSVKAIIRPLDVSIRLSRAKTQSYTIETDITNTSGDLGLRGNLVYSNRNLFRGGEMLSVRLSTALESRSDSSYVNSNDNLFFNTMEYGLYLNFRTVSFLVPVKLARFPKYLAPRTIFQLSYNFQIRPKYKRHLGNASFGYEWNTGKYTLHNLFPIDLSIIKIFPSQQFQDSLDANTNIRYKDQYTDHLISALRYNLIYNTQKNNKWSDFTYLLFRFELAGNLASLSKELTNAQPSADGYYNLFGIRYAQYIRGELDFRKFYAFPREQGFIYRTILGIGIPYGNSSALPFEKGFYGGGANGMRGWAYRTLGPGSNSDLNMIGYDKMGEIKLEASAEYRFPIIWYLNGALFADVGNIWLLEKNDLFPDGNFKLNTFASQLAADGGFGFRFDFGFFLVRLDAALKIRNPAKAPGSRFVLGKSQFSDIYWNFGIGYPF